MSLAASSSPIGYRLDEPRKFAPVALFVYNRPEHTQRTVNSLRENEIARDSDLFVFSDGPKNEEDTTAVQQVRRYIRKVDGFRSVTIIERERNLGLANSVIGGVTQLCEEYDRVIAVEDDLLTTKDFLTFMDRALERYKNELRVFSVSGFNFPLRPTSHYSYDAFCSYRSSSWGWGTWKDRWEDADWGVSDYAEFRTDKKRRKMFDRGGEDLSWMLDLQMTGRVDSWSIRWDYAHFKHNAFALLPVVSRVYNIGLDGSGVHCRRPSLKQTSLTDGLRREYRFPETSEPDAYLVAEIRRLHRRSPASKILLYLRSRLEPR
jgi:hypothetical protein